MSSTSVAPMPVVAHAEGRLPSPRELRSRFPVPPRLGASIARVRREIGDILRGHDPRLLLIVGPCSIHDPEAAVEYAHRLRPLAETHARELLVVMRTYVEKPRSRDGWKGLLNDPGLDGSCDAARGLGVARSLLRAIGQAGLPCASELLDPLAARYLVDLLSWGAVGARTVESQPHRELASGLGLPVGFKNGTDGDLGVAFDAVETARRPHSFLGIDAGGTACLVRTAGNPDAHVVLRGGGGVPNYDAECVAWASTRARKGGLRRPLVIDCSHGNSGKNHRVQGAVCRAVLSQVRAGQEAIAGLMLESNLEPGAQPWTPGHRSRPRPGVSLTDPCIGWNETRDLLEEIAAAVKTKT
ncbi:MAG: 3-deoxy-7-phosphoheptulonate synthase [Proteobacteria bacterium]|nr:3-deoxy-7-phosphoheptulonate synthase [Pseudomonadota bacterium]